MKYLDKIIAYGLYVLIFLLPWQTRLFLKIGQLNGDYFEYGTISLYLTDVVLSLLLAVFLIRKLKKTDSKFSNLNFQFWSFIALLDLVAFVSIFSAQDKFLAIYKYASLLLGVGLFLILLSANYSRLKLFWSLLAGMTLQALLALWQFLSQTTFSAKWLGLAAHNPATPGTSVVETLNGERWLRVYGSLDHPNVLGGVLAFGILVLISLFLQTESKRKKLFISLLFVILLSALFFTFSRGAWAGLALAILILALAFSLKKDWSKAKLLFKIVLVSSLIIFALAGQYRNLTTTRFSQEARLEKKSNTERVESYKRAWPLIKSDWLVGLGMGNYTSELSKDNSNLPAGAYQPVHNTFLLIWAETGIFGILAFLAFLAGLAWKSRNHFFGLAALGSMVVMMQVDHWWWSLHFGVLFFWLIAALVYKESQIDKNPL